MNDPLVAEQQSTLPEVDSIILVRTTIYGDTEPFAAHVVRIAPDDVILIVPLGSDDYMNISPREIIPEQHQKRLT